MIRLIRGTVLSSRAVEAYEGKVAIETERRRKLSFCR